MFALGLHEILFIFLAFIIFLKPQDYPKIIKNIAKALRKINLFWNNLLNQIDMYD